MTWLRLEDNMLDHPKWRRAVRSGGDGVVAVWFRMVSWCSRNLTDGLIPSDMLEEVADVERARDRRKAIDGLVSGGLLVEDRSPSGSGLVVVWRLSGYLERNPSRAQVLAGREQRAQSQRNRRHASPVTGLHETSEPERNEVPSQSHPNPISPIPPDAPPPAPPAADAAASERESKGSRKRRAKRETVAPTSLPSDWQPTAAHRDYAVKHGLDVELEADGFRGWADGRQTGSWDGTFSTRLANAAKWKRERGVTGKPRPDLSSEAAWLR
jgi:hypothetical protein